MARLNARQTQLYGEATRIFVDYAEYTREECIFYYNLLRRVHKAEELNPSGYLISGVKKVVNSVFEHKTILEWRFGFDNTQSVAEMAEKIGITKQGLLLRFEDAYRKIRAMDYEYDIHKRMEMLKNTLQILEDLRTKHKVGYCKSDLPLDVLPLSSRAQYSLTRSGITTVGQFVKMTRSDFATIKGVGEKTLENIVENQRKLLEAKNVVDKPFTVEELGLSTRATVRLRRIGIETLEQFLSLKKERLLRAWSTGEKTWQEIYNKQQQLKRGDI
ncbi:MAG: hypothetical protein IJ272_10005 [Clostridia bacterium]|nr:hypothetical protein [Clostridia bacterium]